MDSSVIDHQQAIDNMMAERYLLGELAPQELDAFEAHVFECSACFEQVRAGTELVDCIKKGGVEEPAVTTTTPRWRQLLGQVFRPAPAFAALVLGFSSFSVYQAVIIHGLKESRVMAAPALKASRRTVDENVVTARRDSIFSLHFLFDPKPDYTSYEGRISRDAGVAQGASTSPVPGKGNPTLKSFYISKKDAQEPLAVNLYSGGLVDGDYVLKVLGVKEDGSKASVATYYFKLKIEQ
jgi:hypothetical protein